MKSVEILTHLSEVIALLQAARGGSGTATERAARRQQAGQLLQSLPAKWWKKMPAVQADRMLAVLADLA